MEMLTELALDLRWSWNHTADELWRQLDSELWEITHNPWIMLQTVSRDRVEKHLSDEGFRQKMNELVKLRDQLNNITAHVSPEQVIYIDDVQVFVDVSTGLGIKSICHTNYLSASNVVTTLGLKLEQYKIYA